MPEFVAITPERHAKKRLKKEVFAKNMENVQIVLQSKCLMQPVPMERRERNVTKMVAQARLNQEVFAENTADDCTTNA